MRRPNKQRRQIIPWGWNHVLRKRLINEGIDQIIYQTGAILTAHIATLAKE